MENRRNAFRIWDSGEILMRQNETGDDTYSFIIAD